MNQSASDMIVNLHLAKIPNWGYLGTNGTYIDNQLYLSHRLLEPKYENELMNKVQKTNIIGTIIHELTHAEHSTLESFKDLENATLLLENVTDIGYFDGNYEEFDRLVSTSIGFTKKSELAAMKNELNYYNSLCREDFQVENVNFLDLMIKGVEQNIENVKNNRYFGTDLDSEKMWRELNN